LETEDAETLYKLGFSYLTGQGVPRDIDKSRELFLKSVMQNKSGKLKPMFKSLSYLFNHCETKTREEIVEWFGKSAEQGDAEAQFLLGSWHFSELIEGDDGAEWFSKAAEQGHVEAQYCMGLLYEGYGNTKDHAKAVEWYVKAAEQGYVDAQYSLGLLYNEGQGAPQDDAKAAEWFSKAAEQGRADAQCIMGFLYELGQGVPVDIEKAKEWFSKSVAQGNDLAKNYIGLAYAAQAAALDEEIRKQVRKKLNNRIIPNLFGQKYHGLTAIPTDNLKKCIYLLKRMDEEKEYSLWNIEYIDDVGNAKMWPYDGADYDDLMRELLELYIETAFENVD